jgi:hypothetical protein
MVHWAIGISNPDKVLGGGADDEESLTKLRHGRPFHVKKSQAPTLMAFHLDEMSCSVLSHPIITSEISDNVNAVVRKQKAA